MSCERCLAALRSIRADTRILPSGSFSSVSPFTDEAQRPYAASWHGFFGEFEALRGVLEVCPDNRPVENGRSDGDGDL